MRPLRCFAFVLWAVPQRVCDPDLLDDEDLLLQVDLAFGLRGQTSLARVNPARLQRAAESARESTGGRSNDIVKRGGVLRVLAGRRAVVLAHGPMRAEENGLVFGGEERLSNRSAVANDPHF